MALLVGLNLGYPVHCAFCVQDRDVTFVENEPGLISLKEFATILDAGVGALRQSLSAVVCALLDDEGQAEWRTMSDAGRWHQI